MNDIAQKVEKYGLALSIFCFTKPLLIIFTSLIFCLSFAVGAYFLKFSSDYQIFFSKENPELKAFNSFENTFGKADNISFVVLPKTGTIYQQNVINAVYDLTELSWGLPNVSRVDSLTNFQHSYASGDDLFVEDLVSDPTHIKEERLKTIKSTVDNEPLLKNFIVSDNGSATIVNAILQLDREDAESVEEAVKKARIIQKKIQTQYPDLEIKLTGITMISHAFSEISMQDALYLIPSMYILVFVVMLLVLRSLAATFSALCIIFLSTLFGVGVGGWMNVALTPISVTAPIIILTIAVADAVHIINALKENMKNNIGKDTSISMAVASNIFPISLTSITTIIGFLTLNFSDSPPFHHLGNMTAAGVFMAWVLSLTFLPAILKCLPLNYKPIQKSNKSKQNYFRSLGLLIYRFRYLSLAIVVLNVSLLISMIPRLEFNDVWSKYFDTSVQIRQDIDQTQAHFGTDTIEFIVDSQKPQNAMSPDFLNDIEGFSNWLKTQKEVTHVYSITDVIKRLSKNMNADDDQYYTIPNNQKLANQYLLFYELSLPYGMNLNDRIDIEKRKARITTTIFDISTLESKLFIERAESWFLENSKSNATLKVTGVAPLFNHIAERNIKAMFHGSLCLLMAVSIVISLSFRSLGIGLLSIILNSVPIFATFGLWAILVGNIGFSISIVGAVAVGLVIDDTIHLLHKYIIAHKHQRQSVRDSIAYAFQTSGAAIFATTLILTIGFSILITSAFKPNVDLGLMTAIAICFAMIINFLTLPALFSLKDNLTNNTKGS